MVQNNAYADDVVIISRNLKALEEELQELDNISEKNRTDNQSRNNKIYESK
jgi:hypothetical protein